MSRKPAAANPRASASVETVIPPKWPRVCIRAASTHLWVLTWGRSRTPSSWARSAMRVALRSSRSRSTRAAGGRQVVDFHGRRIADRAARETQCEGCAGTQPTPVETRWERCHPLEAPCQVGSTFPGPVAMVPTDRGVSCCSHLVVAAVGAAGRREAAFRRFHSPAPDRRDEKTLFGLPTRPDLRSSSCRALPAPATHQDQGDGISRRMIPAPGAIRRPRKSSSSADRVHAIGTSQALGYPVGRQHLLAHGRRAGRSQSVCDRGGSIQAHRFFQHRSWLPPRPTSFLEELRRIEVHLIPHHVVGGSRQLVSERPDGDDAVGLRLLALEVLPGLLVVAIRMVRSL